MSRKDSWLPEDDKVLAETVLEFVSNGKTQGEAFEEASKLLVRTAAACGFRWNSEVRKRYVEALSVAKLQRKGLKQDTETTHTSSITLSEPLEATQDDDPFDTLITAAKTASAAYKRLQKDNDRLRREVIRLERKLEEMPQASEIATLKKFIESAKKSGLFGKESPAS